MGSIYSVLQVNNYIKNMISQDFLLADLMVQGEVSNCKYHHSGHVYFTLKEEGAAISCVMFAGNRAGLAFSMRDGDKVIVSGMINLYEKTGTYQLYAKKIRLAGAGDLYERFIALKNELEEMGMFAAEYKKPLPKHTKRLGVVTAPTGAAIHDIQNIVRRRNPGVQIILFPALVQGEGAKESIVKGIQTLDKAGVDLIIVGRGGGSIEDLWAFNEESVARAVFDCETPIISAVGHETDYTIADFAADLRAPTPSAAAELAVENIFDTVEKLSLYEKRIEVSMRRNLRFAQMRLEQYSKRVAALNPSLIIESYKDRLKNYHSSLKRRMEYELSTKKQYLEKLCDRMEALSPLKRLKSGFSYVNTAEGKTLSSVKQLSKGDIIDINLRDGIIKASVEEINTIGEKIWEK